MNIHTNPGKKKVIKVPLDAVTFAGLKTKFPPAPTSIYYNEFVSLFSSRCLCKLTLIWPVVLGGADGAGAAAEEAGAGGRGP